MGSSENNKAFEKIYFAQGEEVGELFFEAGTMGVDVVPKRFLVDSDGGFIFLENSLNRVQKFSRSGKYMFSYDVESAYNNIGLSIEEAFILDIFLDVKGSLRLLIYTSDDSSSGTRYYVVRYDRNGRFSDFYSLKGVPGLLTSPEMAFLDRNNYLWLGQSEWFTFDPEGNLNASLSVFGTYVDQSGNLYGGYDPLKVYDRDGKQLGTLRYEVGPSIDSIDGGDFRTSLVFSWNQDAETAKNEASVVIPNNLRLFYIYRDSWHLQPIAELELPASKFSFPDPNLDQAVPMEVYIRETCILEHPYVLILGYSEKEYWILKVDASDYLPQ